MKYKVNQILKDDVEKYYRIVDILPNSLIVEPFPNRADLATEIMSFRAIENEKWEIAGQLTN